MRDRMVRNLVTAVTVLVCLQSAPALADLGDCGQPQSNGSSPTATDALGILKGAIGLASGCDAQPCVCDVSGDGNVSSSDALQVLKVAVGQPISLACDCGSGECVLLGELEAGATLTTPGPAVDVPVRQVLIETKLIGINEDSFDELGIGFEVDMSSPITTDSGPAPGGTNGEGRTLAVDSSATGGPPNVQFLVFDTHPEDGALPILNLNFISAYDAIRSFLNLPPGICVLFPELAVTEPDDLPFDTPVENPASFDPGYGGGELLYTRLGLNDANALLAAIDADSRNTVLAAPNVTAYPGQTVVHIADDVFPTVDQLTPEFRTAVQNIAPQPFGIFTGVAIDVVPTINNDDTISIELRPGTRAASFFGSIAFTLNGVPVDMELPVIERSRSMTTVVLADGETAVIAGLLQDGMTQADKGLPILDDLPLIGTAFSHQRLDPATQNLLIFVTARIVDPS